MAALTVVDYIILGIVAVSAVIGLVRGLVREILSLAIWLAAFTLALVFADEAAAQLGAAISNDTVRLVAGFLLVFSLVLVAGAVLQWLIGKAIESTGLTGTDRLLGFVFGSARGALVCLVALVAARPLVGEEEWWRTSTLIPRLTAFEEDVISAFGEGLRLFDEMLPVEDLTRPVIGIDEAEAG